MKIGIIGAGAIGETLAKKLSKYGHQIFVANSRGAHTIAFADNEAITAVELRDATTNVDVVIISIPFGKVAELPKNLFSDLNENVPVIETMNYFPHRDGIIEEIENGKPHSVWVSEQIGRPVVKAFNNIVTHSFRKYGQPHGTSGRIALTVSSDNEDWKKIAFQIIDETGFDSYDAGSLIDSWRQQPGSPPYCTDLTIEEMAEAIIKSDKKQTVINRDLSNEKIAELGEEYMNIVVTTNYPDNFDDKAVNIYRSINGIPLK
ncbi:NAD(P)-binding domain-containing protein [Chryseobacterium sp. 09-1422]|uniref:NAD(P)-binding domain-containing protein n=1 Tax=Chryseobacterium kimseyorum TaxID=2984028 RepID=A0ABT3I3S1_9FLAO|nr:NAD(P)-binding domain-containing protein [Chryseobacterium kimseyorum]MCW3170667.1 NAD(P)-binding domain-containing protein [Chryseobacterium kimseyorum]